MEIFGAKVDERLTAVEASATDASAKVDAHEGRISDLEAVNVDTEKRLKEAEAAAKAAKAAVQELEEKKAHTDNRVEADLVEEEQEREDAISDIQVDI